MQNYANWQPTVSYSLKTANPHENSRMPKKSCEADLVIINVGFCFSEKIKLQGLHKIAGRFPSIVVRGVYTYTQVYILHNISFNLHLFLHV